MRAVVFRLRRAMRHHRVRMLITAGIVAVVSGAVLTLAAGARRTSAAPDAFTAAVGGDPDALVTQHFERPRTDEVAAIRGVGSAEAMTFLFASLIDPVNEQDNTIAFAGSRTSTSMLIRGRWPDRDEPHEFVSTPSLFDQYDAQLGDRFRLVTWTQEQVNNDEGFAAEPGGPTIEGVLVGEIQAPEDFEDDFVPMLFPPSLLDEDIGVGLTLTTTRLEDGFTLDRFRAALDELPSIVVRDQEFKASDMFAVESTRVISDEVRSSVEAQARGTWLIAGAAAVAAVIALGQLLSRHARLIPSERDPLAGMGFTSRQLAGEAIGRAAVPAALGVAVGAALSVSASGLFPAGFVRGVEPNPGLKVDPQVLVIGGLAFLLLVLAWVGVTLLLARSGRAQRANSSRTGEVLARNAPSATAATGARFALARQERSNGSVLGTLLALGLIVAGIVGATTFAVSLDRLVSDGDRYGSNYDYSIGDLTGLTPDELRELYVDDPDIGGLMILSSTNARVGDSTIGIVGLERVLGDLAPRVLAGRLPAGRDEVAVGRVTARELDVGIGDQVALDGPEGAVDYQVVGVVVIPTIADIDGVGIGLLTTMDGIAQLGSAGGPSNLAAIALRPGAPPSAGQRLAGKVGEEQAGIQSTPASIVNVSRVRRIPAVLAGLLAALAVLTVVHALIVSVNARYRDLAVLRALGADGGWIERAVHWQATVLTTAPLVLGIPLGLLAGSVVFRAFVDRIGAWPEPAVPVLFVLLLMAGLVVVANLAAIIPAWRARRAPPSELLQGE